MKVLLCSDIHNHKPSLALLRSKSKNVDLIICAGDMSLWDCGLESTLKELSSFGKPVFVIHGNHEDAIETKNVCLKFDNLTFFHKEVVKFKDLFLIGFGGGGFSLQDKGFENFIKRLVLKDYSRAILVTHGPPFETCLDEKTVGVHVGCESYKRFILKNKPLVAVSGHIHETSGMVCNLGDVILINPGSDGVIVEL